jgi:type II secretion system protein N
MASRFASLGSRLARLARLAGLALLALTSFAFALQRAFPYDRIRDAIIRAAAEQGYDAQIGDVEPGIIPARVVFRSVMLRSRPTRPGDTATMLYIDRAELDVGLLSALRGGYSGEFDLQVGSGRLRGRGAYSSQDGLSVHLVGDDLPAASVPLRGLVGLPMTGKLHVALDAAIPNTTSRTGRTALDLSTGLRKGEASAELACPAGCAVGDGTSRLKLTTSNARQQEFLDQGGGIEFGKINLDSFVARAELRGGKLELTRFEIRSGDGELRVAASLALDEDLASSKLTGCLQFHGSEALRKREPKTDAAISTIGPLGPDGLFHVKLEGALRTLRPIGAACSAGADGAGETPGGARPSLTAPQPARPPGPRTVGLPPPAVAAPPVAPPATVAPVTQPAAPAANSPPAAAPEGAPQ